MVNMTSECCAKAFLHGWVSNFGVPTTLVSDQGRQFEGELWAQLMQLMGTAHSHTTAYHPQANGEVERFHRTLKAALRTKLDRDNWIDVLPMVMLGIRSAPKEDLGFSAAEIVYGAPLRLPGCYYDEPTSIPVNQMVRDAQQVASSLLPVFPWHGRHRMQMTPRLWDTTHVLILDSSVHPSLQNAYKGPYKVISRSRKYFNVQVGNAMQSVSVDRLKPMPTVEEVLVNIGHGAEEEVETGGPSIPPPQTTRAGRQTRMPARFRDSANSAHLDDMEDVIDEEDITEELGQALEHGLAN